MRNLFQYALQLLLGMAVLGSIAFPHGGQNAVPLAPEDDDWTRAEPLSGASAFAEKLRLEGRGLLNDGQYHELETALSHYSFANQIQAGWYQIADETDAEYNRQMGDNIVLSVTEAIDPTLVLDYTSNDLPHPEDILPYDPVAQVFLMKVKTSEGPASFRSQVFDMVRERYIAPYGVNVAPEGTTYVLLMARDVPLGHSKTGVALIKEGEEQPFRWHAFTLEVELPGSLRLDIQNENGEACPALLRIANAETEALAVVEDSQDFYSLLHDVTGPVEYMPPGLSILGPDGCIRAPIPGDRRGYYWLAKGDVEVPLAAGDWEVMLVRGIEYAPWQKTVTVRSGEWTEETAKLERWVNMAELGWYSGDDHVHAQMMNGRDAETLTAFAEAMDIRVANILEMGDPQRSYYSQRGFGEAYRVQQNGYWLVAGMEDPRSILGHNIGMNLTSMARDLDKYLQLDWIAEEVHRQGGLFGQTHVGQNMCFAHRGMALMMPFELYDFVSIMQGGLGTELYYDFLDLGYQLPATAGSDMPYNGIMGDVRVYVYTGEANSFTPDAWFDGVRAGHTFTTNGPMLEFTVNGKIPGETITVTDDTPLTVKARAWGYPGESAPVSLQVVSLSEPLETARADNLDGEELSIKLDVPPGEGMWIAARSWGKNGSAAHTTPVYIQRPGKRHWNPSRVDEVIEKQLAALDEIEAEIVAVKEREASGGLNPLDFGSLGIFREREELRDLMARSRAKYDELRAALHQ